MNLNNEGSSANKILFSVLVAALLLAGASFLFVAWAVPAYNIDIKTVYSILIRLFPILIGIILMQIGIILASSTTIDKADSKDLLVPDDYDNPLYTLPNEDPSLNTFTSRAFLEPSKAAPLGAIIQPASPEVEPYAPPIATFTPVQPVIEVVVPHVETTPLTNEAFQNQLDLAPLTQAVLFKDYPYPIEENSEIAELLSPLPETEAMDDPILKQYQVILEDTLGNRLDSEIESAKENHYGLSLGVISLPGLDTDPQDVENRITQSIFQKLDSVAFFYVLDENRIAVILPFYQFDQAKRFFASLLENIHKAFPESSVHIGFSSLQDRPISKIDLFDEVKIASSWAKEQKGFSLIGYEIGSDTKEIQFPLEVK